MLPKLPAEIVYWFSEYMEDINKLMFVNKSIYIYVQKEYINRWRLASKLLIDYCNNEKSTLLPQNILNNWTFFRISSGTYRTDFSNDDEDEEEIHNHIFITLDTYYGSCNIIDDGSFWEKAIVYDCMDNRIRGMITYDYVG
jgi:hypothetical protein